MSDQTKLDLEAAEFAKAHAEIYDASPLEIASIYRAALAHERAKKPAATNTVAENKYEFRITIGPRKSWDQLPDLELEGWERINFERLEYHEEITWRRKLPLTPRTESVTANSPAPMNFFDGSSDWALVHDEPAPSEPSTARPFPEDDYIIWRRKFYDEYGWWPCGIHVATWAWGKANER